MKLIAFVIISFLLCLCFACASNRQTRTRYLSYEEVLDTLTELRKPALKKLDRFDKDLKEYYVVPYFKSQMDTLPSLELFLSGRFKDHLVFSGPNNPVMSPWYFKDIEHGRYLVYNMNNISVMDYQPSIDDVELMYQNNVEMAFSVGAEAGPNIPTFLKTKDDVILCYYDRELKKNIVMSIEDYLKIHPEFIEKMPLPYLRMKAIQNE